MKKILLATTVLIASLCSSIKAQTIIDLESLSVPAEGYYNGSTDHSGTIGTYETFYYEEELANFQISYGLEETYDYWNGFAYSNQTDLETADWTNYSAYSEGGGGAEGSANYLFVYFFGSDSIMFDQPVQIQSMKITNSVWAFHYMNGTDGFGTGTYETGDFYRVSITGIIDEAEYTDPIIFSLADFTNDNSILVEDWTTLDISQFGNITGLKFELSSSDSFTPYYFCIDDITYDIESSAEFLSISEVSIYPNPANDYFSLLNLDSSDIIITNVNGQIMLRMANVADFEKIDISNLTKGMYFVSFSENGSQKTQKLIIQ